MTFEDKGIFIKDTSGQEKTTCPKCSNGRKKSSDRCLSVNVDDGVWHCHHCGWKGSLDKKLRPLTIPKPIVKPTPPETRIPEKIYQWFEDRGITRSVVDSE